MKKLPLNNTPHSGRSYGARHTPYNWKTYENAYGRGYQSAEGNSYQRFSASNAGSQPRDDDFIPLNISTPMTRHEKYNTANRYSGRGSPGGWYNNYRGNYHTTPRSNDSSRHSAFKYSPKQFQGQKRKGYKGAHRQVNVSAYVDMNSFLEDPWEGLVKKLDDSKDMSKSEGSESEFLSNPKLIDSNLLEKSKNQLSKDTNLNDSQCSQENKNEYSVDTTFETNTDISQVSKLNSSIESEIEDVCFSQDSLNESTSSISNKNYETQENNIHSNMFLTDVEQKDI